MTRRPKVLVLSRSYPNNLTELLGLWVRQLVAHSTAYCEPRVISPVPYCPPLPGLPDNFARFRRIDRRSSHDGVEVHHPRFVIGPGYSLYRIEWISYYAGIRNLVDKLRNDFPFELIHAHFSYPDGVVAIELGRHYGVPVIITEHIPWDVWAERPRLKRRAARAVRECLYHLSVSESVRVSVEQCVGRRENLLVVPNGVDGSLFKLPADGQRRKPGQILFAGAVRPVKGVDVLLKALRLLADRKCDANLVVVGEPFYGRYKQEEARLRQMVTDLGIQDRVQFLGKKMPSEVASYMQESAVLVLPSRLESFGMVLVEALACGTPVVATRCGGPEDIVNERVGLLIPPENPEALANGIEQVLARQEDYKPAVLRAHALDNFGLEAVGRRMAQIYEDAASRFGHTASQYSTVMGGSVAG